MNFEFDKNKSAANLAKHGIDFIKAQELWNDKFCVTATARDTDRQEILQLGKIGD